MSEQGDISKPLPDESGVLVANIQNEFDDNSTAVESDGSNVSAFSKQEDPVIHNI